MVHIIGIVYSKQHMSTHKINMVGHKSLQNRCLHMITWEKNIFNITPTAVSYIQIHHNRGIQ